MAGKGQDTDPTGPAAAPRAAHAEDREQTPDAAHLVQQVRDEQVQRIIADAAARDEEADARDAAADQRDEATSLAAFLSDRDDYGAALEARRSAAVDRLDSKLDRTSSAQDRSELSDSDLE